MTPKVWASHIKYLVQIISVSQHKYCTKEDKKVANTDFKQFSIFIEYILCNLSAIDDYLFRLQSTYIIYVNIIFIYSV